MTQLTINIEDRSILPHLKKILSAIDGISIAPSKRKRKSGIELAMEDVRAGRVHTAKSVDEMFDTILSE